MSEIQVTMHDGPLPPRQPWQVDGAGVVMCFEGIVRPLEGEKPIEAICYEEYHPMTLRVLEELAEQMLQEHQLLAIHVEHSRGNVPVGCISFRLLIAAEHRQEAIAAQDQFISLMKRDVPLWKEPRMRVD